MVGEGDAVVSTKGTYPTLNYFLAGRGAAVHTVPYGEDDRQDTHALVQKAAEVDAKLIYFVNPDNPTGTWLDPEEIEAMIDSLPKGCLLLLDEAYHELGPLGSYTAPWWRQMTRVCCGSAPSQ